MELLRVLLIAVVLVGLAFSGLAIKVLIKKRGKFPNIHIGSNKDMKARGITCAQTFDKIEQAKARKELTFKELTILKESTEGGC